MLSLIHLGMARFSGRGQVASENKLVPSLSVLLIGVRSGTVVNSKNCS